jgi:hypothetical protein
MDGTKVDPGSTFRYGTFRDTNGTMTMNIWLNKKSRKPVSFEINKSAAQK